MSNTQGFFDLLEKLPIENDLKIQWLNIFSLKQKVSDNIFRYNVDDNVALFIMEKQGKYEALLLFDEKGITFNKESIPIQKELFSFHYNIEITQLTSIFIPESEYKGSIFNFILNSLYEERKIQKREVIYNLMPFSPIESFKEVSENESPSFHLIDINTESNEEIERIYDEKKDLYSKIEIFSDRDLSLSIERKKDSLILSLK